MLFGFGCGRGRHRGKAEESLWSQAVKAANALQTTTCAALAAKKDAAAETPSLDELLAAGEEEEGEGEAGEKELGKLLRKVLGVEAAEAVDVDELEFHVSPALLLPLG